MQTTKSSTFSVESLISKESFEPRVDAHSCITLPRCSLGPERTRTSPSFTNSITIPRPLALEGVSAGHTSAFSQTSQSPLSSGRTFAIPPRASEHHQGILPISFQCQAICKFVSIPTLLQIDRKNKPK